MSEFEFETIFQAHRDRVFQLALRITGVPSEAEDVCQEVFLRALENMGTFRQESQVYTWLHRITLNLAIDHLRAAKRFPKAEENPRDEDPGLPLVETLPDPSPTHPQILEQNELSLQIRETILRMKPKLRDVLILREMQEMTHEQIAQVLNISLKAVGVRLIRARNQFKLKMQKYL